MQEKGRVQPTKRVSTPPWPCTPVPLLFFRSFPDTYGDTQTRRIAGTHPHGTPTTRRRTTTTGWSKKRKKKKGEKKKENTQLPQRHSTPATRTVSLCSHLLSFRSSRHSSLTISDITSPEPKALVSGPFSSEQFSFVPLIRVVLFVTLVRTGLLVDNDASHHFHRAPPPHPPSSSPCLPLAFCVPARAYSACTAYFSFRPRLRI
ncbi:hypothetical protein EX30DRAFT_337298 [Ascodesmis nigricans]|uniref:Uncharacterized protein n=1 Tax=Ascodesmis nigricans TaxID=341454 RepID=A0A4S2N6D3_9PEZI|nr:hypothetical protein EX30DRAFT_337298 [Ascodesmis nigricans]